MRIANKTIYDDITYNLTRTSEAMIKANMVVSSGKKIRNPVSYTHLTLPTTPYV